MERIEQSPHDLCLIVSRQASTIPLTVIRQKTLPLGSGQASFKILSESHLVLLEFNGMLFQESLFCTKQLPIKSMQADHVHNFDDLQAHQYNNPVLEYAIQIKFGAAALWREVDYGEASLGADFAEVFGHIPRTEIAWQLKPDCLQWRTLHIYPTNNAIIHVISESSIRLPLVVV